VRPGWPKLEVDRCDVGDLEPFGSGDDGGVHIAERCGDELADELGRSAAVLKGRCADLEVGCDRGRSVQEARLQDRAVAYMVAQEVAGLTEDWLRNEELAWPVRQ
jgi:hypothetical protein